mgnify:CR=1 FL=1
MHIGKDGGKPPIGIQPANMPRWGCNIQHYTVRPPLAVSLRWSLIALIRPLLVAAGHAALLASGQAATARLALR